jgi:hypothetical protein
MAKKEKIHLQHSSDLEAIDADLATAMDTLDSKNQQINDLLRQFEPPPQITEQLETPVKDEG